MFKMKLFRVLVPLLLVLIGISGYAIPVSAATTAVVTVTAAPAFIAITIAPTTYTINSDNSGSGKVAPSTTYYSNPLGGTTAPSATVDDSECDFTVTNTSTIVTDLTGNMSDFASGDAMANVNGATPGANSYSAYAYYSGETFSAKVLLKSSGSATGNFKSSLGATTNLKVGFQLSTQTGAWASGTSMTSTLTITATAH